MKLDPDLPLSGDEEALAADPSLEAGLAALKQSNYKSAIATLEGVCQAEPSLPTLFRAQMGLVVAYGKVGEIQKAIALCQTLTCSKQPKVEQWASATLADFAKRYPHLKTPETPASDSTGFVPLDRTPPDRSNNTGFVAFNPPTGESESKGSRDGAGGNAPDRGSVSQSPIPNSHAPNPHFAGASGSSIPNPQSYQPSWRQAGRAGDSWRPLKPIKLGKLLFVEAATAIALFWVIREVVKFAMATTNIILPRLPFGQPIQAFYSDPIPAILIFASILLVTSPWLIDGLLKLFYGLKPLPLSQLAARSPESAKVLQRYCRQRRLPLPTLAILPVSAPVALTYGNLPRTARIAISEGLLAQLADDELATVCASQLGHIVNWDFAFMSLVILVVQLPYTVYWQVAEWGDRMKAASEEAKSKGKKFLFFLFTFTYFLAAIVSSVSYGLYLLFRLPVLWFSRARIPYSDRMAAEITGNPNGFTRALLKIAIGIADEVQKYRATSWLLEGFDLLMPLGHKQAISLGSCYRHTAFEPVLKWDCNNPYRKWLAIGCAHPLTGDRLRILSRFAQFWQLDTELDLEAFTQPSGTKSSASHPIQLLLNNHKALPLLQSALLWGLVLGLGLRGLMWAIGLIGKQLSIWQTIWLYQDKDGTLLAGCLLIAFSIGIFTHINTYFPDIKPSTLQTEPSLPNLYINPAALPPDSQPVSLSGKLLGRRGISNWLGQDLILQVPTGLIKLNFLSRLGSLGNLWPQSTRPSDLMDREVTAFGWFRRGATPWIDLETLRTEGGKTSRAGYPVWLTILACASAVWGAYTIWQGSV